ncbi:MAG: metal ABC transporter permease [Candidatus Methylacidiphilales bacterium]
MIEFFQVLGAEHGRFLRWALLAGLLAAPAFGVVGTLVVVRKISGLAGALSHCILAGVGAALFLQVRLGWDWCHPLIGAIVVGALASWGLTWVTLKHQAREDTWISFLWAGGMAVGLLFFAATPKFMDPMSYLFGNILMIQTRDLVWLLILNVVTAGLFLGFHTLLLSVCFDEFYARISGQPVFAIKWLLLFLTTLTIILMVQIMGVILVIALLVMPAATASLFSRNLWWIMAGAAMAVALSVAVGLALSFVWEMPTGPVIILITGLGYALALLGKRWAIR